MYGVIEFVEVELVIGVGDFFEEGFYVDDFEVVGVEGMGVDDVEIGVVYYDWVGCVLFVVGEEVCVDVVDVGFEWVFEVVFLVFECGEDGDVVGCECVFVGVEGVVELVEVDELGGL